LFHDAKLHDNQCNRVAQWYITYLWINITLHISDMDIPTLQSIRYNQKTWGCSHVQHPDVLVHNMGMFLMKTWGCFES
jgi:hypothetical protein